MNEIIINGQTIPGEVLNEAQYASTSEELMHIAGQYGIPLSQDMADAVFLEEMNDYDDMNGGCDSSNSEPVTVSSTESSAEKIPRDCFDWCSNFNGFREYGEYYGNRILQIQCCADNTYKYIYAVDYSFVPPDSCPLKR